MATKTYYEPKEEAVPWLVGIDMQKFICGYGANFIGSSYVSCVGIGCQPQWGASGYAVTFPIAFNVVYNVLSIPQTTASTSNAYWGRFYITALTKNGFNVSDTGAGSNIWIAIGSAQPQWGIVHAEQGYIIVTLPLAYSSNKYVVIGQDLDYTSNDTDGYGETVGVTQVTTTSIRVSITRGRYLSYCTIGF